MACTIELRSLNTISVPNCEYGNVLSIPFFVEVDITPTQNTRIYVYTPTSMHTGGSMGTAVGVHTGACRHSGRRPLTEGRRRESPLRSREGLPPPAAEQT